MTNGRFGNDKNHKFVVLARTLALAYNTTMPNTDFRQGSLVLYKNKPAQITQIGKKLTIALEDGKSVSVRPKDVVLLHQGSFSNLATLMGETAVAHQSGDIEIAWELLEGEITTLADLAELAFDEYTPATAWAAFQSVQEGLYFSGTPDEIVTHSAASVAETKAKRVAKAAEAQAWDGFMARVDAAMNGRSNLLPDDDRFLQEVVGLAYDQQKQARLLRVLKQAESPENAHALLLKTGFWDVSMNPYPIRFGVIMQPPDAELPTLPEESRRDLTHLAAFAIDDEGSKDPDDALSWDNGRFWVHIADVGAIVMPDSPADLEARGRGANLYLPEGTIHMLPQSATQQLGLGLNEISPALSFGFVVNEAGEIGELEIVPSLVRVTRLTYDETETRLDEDPFAEMWAVAQRFYARRLANGAVEIELPEVRVRVEGDGLVGIRPLPHLRSRDLVREAMLMTGEAVAQFADLHDIPIPYSTQDAPNEIDLATSGMAAMFARRKSMKRGRKSSQPGTHAGLGLSHYVQATSPLRRYLDLVVHQQLRTYLLGGSVLDSQAVMERVGAAEAVTGNMRRAERQSNRHWQGVYLLQNPDWQGEGVIIEQRGKRDIVLIPELGIETRIYGKGKRPLDSQVNLTCSSIDLAALEPYFKQI